MDNKGRQVYIYAMNFPRNLYQPVKSYRFGLDALLLAAGASALITSELTLRIAEAGTGCGAAIFAIALKKSNVCCLGIEREQELFDCAIKNASLLNLAHRCEFMLADLQQNISFSAEWMENCHIVIANPPWRIPGNGRFTANLLRKRALWQEKGTFYSFCKTAGQLLAPDGKFCAILPKDQMEPFITAAFNCGLYLSSSMPLAGFAKSEMIRLFLVFQKKICINPSFQQPLILYRRMAEKTVWTEDAKKFCPWIEETF